MKKPITMCFPARKGGVGKSFLTVNVAGFLTTMGKKVLIVGVDQQQDINSYLIDTEFDTGNYYSLEEVLYGQCRPEDAIYPFVYRMCRWEHEGSCLRRKFPKGETAIMYLMPAGSSISRVTLDEENGMINLDVLANALEPIADEFDYILFDTPSSESDMTILAYAASDYAIVPFMGYDSFKSVELVSKNIELLNTPLPSRPKTYDIQMMIVLNAHDPRNPLVVQEEEQLREIWGDSVLRQTVRFGRYAEYSKADATPLAFYQKNPMGEDLFRLTEEIVERIEGE